MWFVKNWITSIRIPSSETFNVDKHYGAETAQYGLETIFKLPYSEIFNNPFEFFEKNGVVSLVPYGQSSRSSSTP